MLSERELDAVVADHYGASGALGRYTARRERGLAPWEKAVLASHHAPVAGEFLVIGGGAGRESKALVELGFTVVSVDTSVELTRIARERAGERERFWCLQLPADELPEQRFAHAALWSQVLANVPSAGRRRALLGLAARSLTPGGRLSLSVHDLDATLALVTSATHVERLGLEAGDFLMTEPGEAPCYWHYFTREEIEALVRDAGLALDALAPGAELGDAVRSNLLIATCHRP